MMFKWSNSEFNHLMSDVVPLISLFSDNKLSFKELKNDGEGDWRKDEGQEVDLIGVSQLVTLVENRLVNSHVPLSGYAHD